MKSYTHFTQEERCVLSAYLCDGLSFRSIAKKLKRSVAGISTEIKVNSSDGTREKYNPYSAHLGSRMRKWDANRKNPMKDEVLCTYVRSQLKEGWSPVTIAGRLKKNHGHCIVSHEAIYQWVYKHGLVEFLPRGKPRRHRKRYRLKASHSTKGLGLVPTIDQRPEEVNSRLRFGDWEGDSMLGGKRGPIISVQQERKSRYILLSKCKDKSAVATRKAITTKFKQIAEPLLQTFTLDRGTENAQWQLFGVDTYFCDPYSSWQKGSVENVIGLLRRYLPKGKSLKNLTPAQLKILQDKINHRPRKSLDFQTPHEVLLSHCKHLGVQLPT